MLLSYTGLPHASVKLSNPSSSTSSEDEHFLIQIQVIYNSAEPEIFCSHASFIFTRKMTSF